MEFVPLAMELANVIHIFTLNCASSLVAILATYAAIHHPAITLNRTRASVGVAEAEWGATLSEFFIRDAIVKRRKRAGARRDRENMSIPYDWKINCQISTHRRDLLPKHMGQRIRKAG